MDRGRGGVSPATIGRAGGTAPADGSRARATARGPDGSRQVTGRLCHRLGVGEPYGAQERTGNRLQGALRLAQHPF